MSLNEGMVPAYAVGIRFLFGGLIFWLIMLFRREKLPLNKKRSLSLLLGIIGTVLIISQSENLGGNNVSIGVIVILLAVLVASWPNAYLKKYKSEVNTFQLNAMSQSIGGIFLFTFAIFTEPGQAMIWTKINLFATAYLIVFGSVITFSLYYWLFSYLSLSQITYVAFFPPIIAIFIGWIFLDEHLSLTILIGAGLILFGALLVNYKRK